jgi:hypothetical protein
MRLGELWPKGLVWVVVTMVIAPAGPLLGQTGNGAPNGAHYNLNIIGVPRTKDAPMDNNNGHRIFVHLGSKKDQVKVTTKIYLVPSFDGTFQVLDANGTDGNGAKFQLPAPGGYTIWARPLGGPGGKAEMMTCAVYVDPLTGDPTDVCPTSGELFVRDKGMRKFTNVTTVLTTVVLEADSDAALACGTTTVSLFDPCLEGYFWSYDNTGLKLLQLRFYPDP